MLDEFKIKVDTAVNQLCDDIDKKYSEQTPVAKEVLGAYLDVLKRGGRRVRGCLTVLSYKMHGGQDDETVYKLAAVVEMIQAYLLVFDDIADQSDVRRGKPSAHKLIESYIDTNQPKKDAARRASCLAQMSGLLGVHELMLQVINLNLDSDTTNKLLEAINRHVLVTTFGQIDDIYAEYDKEYSVDQVMTIISQKTPYYSFVNPLQLGAILAQKTNTLDGLELIGKAVGLGYQILNDILGTFDDKYEIGKSCLDDIRGGKRTLQIVYALENATKEDSKFLKAQLGNNKLTDKDFEYCKQIVVRSGGLQYALDQMERFFDKVDSLLAQNQKDWQEAEAKEMFRLLDVLRDRANVVRKEYSLS